VTYWPNIVHKFNISDVALPVECCKAHAHTQTFSLLSTFQNRAIINRRKNARQM